MTEQTPTRRATYHHGNLRAAMIAATVALVEEAGAEGVTVREAARRAGVSSGAPFRHFPNKTALMTAVAEEAMGRLRAAITAGLGACAADDPRARLAAMGRAYFDWVIANPTHFRVISDRTLIDFDGSDSLRADNAALQASMTAIIGDAQSRGLMRPGDVAGMALALRGLSYGLARMMVDRHLVQWGVPDGGAAAHAAMVGAVDAYLAAMMLSAGERAGMGSEQRDQAADQAIEPR